MAAVPASVVVAFCSVMLAILVPKSTFLYAAVGFNSSYPPAISELKDTIAKLMVQANANLEVFQLDWRDAEVGNLAVYEFDVQIDDEVLPFKLIGDTNAWEYLVRPGEETGLFESRMFDYQMPVIPPFQLEGPMELLIQDADDMRISLPHHVDAGVLNKVILADGVAITVTGARSVSLVHPAEVPFPLPLQLNKTNIDFTTNILSLVKHLQETSRLQKGPLISLRVVGPTSLAASLSSSSSNRLKLKRIAPGVVELFSSSETEDAHLFIASNHSVTLWPAISISGLHPNLLGLQRVLLTIQGSKANELRSLKLLNVNVSAWTLVKMSFGIRKKLKEGDSEWKIPKWRTKPEYARYYFQVFAKVEGGKLVPEKVASFDPVMADDSVSLDVLLTEIELSKKVTIRRKSRFFAL